MSHDFVDQMLSKTRAGELRSPVSETLGMRLVQFGRGEAVYEMEASEQLGNPLGVIQGGVATALADAAMAAATTTILDDDEIQKSAITTIDISSYYPHSSAAWLPTSSRPHSHDLSELYSLHHSSERYTPKEARESTL